MSIRRLRRLAGLRESVADDPHTNAEIDRLLAPYPQEQQTVMLDALDALKMAGPQGLRPQEWADRVRAVHADPDMPLGDTLKIVARMAPVVRRTPEGVYVWVTAPEPIPDDELAADPHRNLVGQQLDLSDKVLAIMRSVPSFDQRELADLIGLRLRAAPGAAAAFAEHFVSTFRHLLEPLSSGRYRMRSEQEPGREGTMAFFRDLAAGSMEGGVGSPTRVGSRTTLLSVLRKAYTWLTQPTSSGVEGGGKFVEYARGGMNEHRDDVLARLNAVLIDHPNAPAVLHDLQAWMSAPLRTDPDGTVMLSGDAYNDLAQGLRDAIQEIGSLS